MKSTRIDRLFVVWLATALTVWAASLVVLWSLRFDLSGASVLRSVAALMLAIAATAGLPARAARALQRLRVALKLEDSPVLALATGGGASSTRRAVRGMMRLLALAAALAAVGGVATTAAIHLFAAAVGDGGRGPLLLGPTGFAVFTFLCQFVGMIPLAMGISVAFLVTVMVRGGSGRDHYASVVREWLGGVAAGLAAAALAWWFGADLLGVGLVAGVAVLAAAGGVFQRVKLTVRPRRVMAPIESSPRRGRWLAVAAGSAAATVVLVVQARLLRDVGEVGLGGQACWAGASIALLAWRLRRADRRSRAPGVAQATGASVGILSAVVFQGSLAVGCFRGGGVAVGCAMLAVAAQVPLAALASVVLSRQRKLFATHGGRARQYLAAVAAGAGGGVALYLAAGATALLAPAGLFVAVGGMVAGVVVAIVAARRSRTGIAWAALGGVLICATVTARVGAVRGLPRLTAGAWLTTASTPAAPAGGGAAWGGLVGRPHWRSKAVTKAVDEAMAAHPGRWWIVAASPADVPLALPAGVHAARAHPDPTAGPVSGAATGEPTGDFLDAVARDAGRFDGLVLAPMPADHPEAWRCYGDRVLRRCRDKLHRGGVLILRTQVAGGGLGDALAAASALRGVMHTGWAVLAAADGYLDVALIARRGADGRAGGVRPGRPTRREGTWVVPLERLWPGDRAPAANRLSGRGALLRQRVSIETLRRHGRRLAPRRP